jgi:hypothetical protein
VEKPAKAMKDCYGIQTTHFDIDKDQTGICAASTAGEKVQSVGAKHDEFPTATIVVRGMYCKWIATLNENLFNILR